MRHLIASMLKPCLNIHKNIKYINKNEKLEINQLITVFINHQNRHNP